MLPILLIVGFLCLSVSPVSPDLLLSFFLGSILIIVGMGIFTLGAETSMTPIGNRIGTALTKSRNLPLILLVSLVLGFSITIAEPDLQVLAETVPHINNTVLLVTVGLGVGFFLAVCMLRIIRGIRLRWLLLLFYGVVFVLAALADSDFLSVAFDSGGVTTGPMTVPFILALGVGVSNIRSDRKAEADSFGLVALCSIGPILAVLVLGFFYSSPETVVETSVLSFANTAAIGRAYLTAIPVYLKEMAVALSPVVLIFLIFQVCSFRLNRRSFLKICVGILYTYVGLVLFLTGVNVGFSSLGTVLGAELTSGWTYYWLIPLAMLLGWFIISAEPAVYVLEKQIEEVSEGMIPGKAIKLSLSIAIAIAMGLSYAPGADGHFHPVVPGARLCAGAGPDLLCAGHLHGHRLRLRRRCLRPHDRHVHAAVHDGCQRGAGRQCAAGRFRRGGAGGHDAADFHPDDGRALRPPQACRAARA